MRGGAGANYNEREARSGFEADKSIGDKFPDTAISAPSILRRAWQLS